MITHLQKALPFLGINNEEQAQLFFKYISDAGYLSDELIDKAVFYLHNEKPFSGFLDLSAQEVAAALKDSLSYFDPADMVDLLTFLTQTAFDRNFGIERNLLTTKSWMQDEEARRGFMKLQESMNLVAEQQPKLKHYLAVGIMGASYPRVGKRIAYYLEKAHVSCDYLYGVTGTRFLSKGLDGEDNIANMAQVLGVTPQFYTDKGQELTKEITETQMVTHLLKGLPAEDAKKLDLIDSIPGDWHWRADTSQNAKDFALKLIHRIKTMEQRPQGNVFNVLLIAEQPFGNRMAKQVQRALDEAAANYNKEFNDTIRFVVEASGAGLANYDTLDAAAQIKMVTQCSSDFAAWIAECYKDARVRLQSESALRNQECLMFSSRDAYYEKSVAAKAAQKPVESVTEPASVNHSFILDVLCSVVKHPIFTATLIVAGLALITVGSLIVGGVIAGALSAAIGFLCGGGACLTAAGLVNIGFFKASPKLTIPPIKIDSINWKPITLDDLKFKSLCQVQHINTGDHLDTLLLEQHKLLPSPEQIKIDRLSKLIPVKDRFWPELNKQNPEVTPQPAALTI